MQIATGMQGDSCMAGVEQLRGLVMHDIQLYMPGAYLSFFGELLPIAHQFRVTFDTSQLARVIRQIATEMAFACAPVQPVFGLLLKLKTLAQGLQLLPFSAWHRNAQAWVADNSCARAQAGCMAKRCGGVRERWKWLRCDQ